MTESSSSKSEQQLQSILENASVQGNLTVGDIEQIINAFNQTHSGSGDNFKGDKTVNNYNNYIINLLEKYRPKNTPQNIPSSNTIKFVGRAESIEQIDRQLKQSGQLAITAVKGMGGIGKTELAIQYSLVHLLVKSYQGGICWLRSREENIGLQIIRFADSHLDLKPPEDWDLKQQVEYCWSRWQDKKEGNVLIVVDDVTDYQEIEAYLPPQSSQFKVLITTRLNLEEIQSVSLDVLAQEEAIELLRKWVGKDEINQQIEDVRELCQRLGYLPLALNLVGRYIHKKRITVRKTLDRLEAKGLSHQSLIVDKKKDKTWTLGIEKGVAAAFELSWEELSEEAQKLGCLLSIFALAPITWSLVEKTEKDTDEEDLEDTRIELENLHLLQQQDETYLLHQLIREYFQGKLDKLSSKDILKRSYVKLIVEKSREVPPTLTIKDIAICESVIPHIMEVGNNLTELLSGENQEIVSIFASITRFYQAQSRYDLALPWSQKCLQQTKQILGEKHRDVVTSMNNLASLHRDIGKYKEAEILYLRALKLLDAQVEEQDSFRVIVLSNNLAELYFLRGNYKEAEILFLRAFKLLNPQSIEQHFYAAILICHLGTLYRKQGRYEKAERLLSDALDLIKTQLGKEHPDVATLQNNLAVLYQEQGKYQQAESLYEQVLNLRKIQLGEQHPDVAQSLNNLAECYQKQGKYQQAEPLFLSALELIETQLGKEHPYLATLQNNLAVLYRKQKKYQQAESLYKQALKLIETQLGRKHPDVATTLNNLAECSQSQGKYQQAESLYKEALELSKKLFGEQHPDTVTLICNLARLYASRKRYKEAEPLFIKGFKLAEIVLGRNHPNTNTVFNNFVYFLKQVIENDRVSELSNHPLTQDLLKNIMNNS